MHPLRGLSASAVARCFHASNTCRTFRNEDFAMRDWRSVSTWMTKTLRIGQGRSQKRRKPGERNDCTRFSADRSGYHDREVDAGVGVNSAGDGETSGDGAAEAMANLVLTSPSSFFSSW